jgi:hypothetical protein
MVIGALEVRGDVVSHKVYSLPKPSPVPTTHLINTCHSAGCLSQQLPQMFITH